MLDMVLSEVGRRALRVLRMASILCFHANSQGRKIERQTSRWRILVDRGDVARRQMPVWSRSTKATTHTRLRSGCELMVQCLQFVESPSKLFILDPQGLVLLHQHVVLRYDRRVLARQTSWPKELTTASIGRLIASQAPHVVLQCQHRLFELMPDPRSAYNPDMPRSRTHVFDMRLSFLPMPFLGFGIPCSTIVAFIPRLSGGTRLTRGGRSHKRHTSCWNDWRDGTLVDGRRLMRIRGHRTKARMTSRMR